MWKRIKQAIAGVCMVCTLVSAFYGFMDMTHDVISMLLKKEEEA